MDSSPDKKQLRYEKVGKDLELDVEGTLGAGEYGIVYRGLYRTNGEIVSVAVKKISMMKATRYETDILREVNLMLNIKCQNIPIFYDVLRTEDDLYLISELCDGGSLGQILDERKTLHEVEALTILKQITRCFLDLSNIKDPSSGSLLCIMHRDLKPQNIMLHNNKVKIIDFGFGKSIKRSNSLVRMRHTVIGTRYYASPQILDEEEYSAKNDVWSAGIIMYEMLVGNKPWIVPPTADEYMLLQKIQKEPLKIPTSLSTQTVKLVASMLQIKEGVRYSWEEVWNDSAIKNVTMSLLHDIRQHADGH
jgi:serine/threonine protein kinase